MISTVQSPTPFNVDLTLANTEYEIDVPEGTEAIEFWLRGVAVLRWSFETGKVAGSIAPFLTVKANNTYWQNNMKLRGRKLYFASPTADSHVEGIFWQ